MFNENQSNKTRIKILLPLPFSHAFDYALGEGSFLPEIGCFVEVFFGSRKMIGVVWALEENPEPSTFKLKQILKILDFPPLTKNIRDFIEWVSDYTLFPLGLVLKMTMSSSEAFFKNESEKGYLLSTVKKSENQEKKSALRLTQERKKVLSFLESITTPLSVSEIAKGAGVSNSVVSGLVQAEALMPQTLERVMFKEPHLSSAEVRLSLDQQNIADSLSSFVLKGFSVSVLNGVTGSGKTEVYFDVIAKALKEGKQALILLPEIGLTGQWLKRFERRFKTKPALWHSGLSARVRKKTWQAVLKQEVKVLAGTRSSLFLPFQNLGCIIVDEEHDASFKQEEGVIYHARDMAVVRAKIEDIPIVLSSATPSLETKINVKTKRYQEFILKERYKSATLPEIALIDMRTQAPLTKKSLETQENLEKQESLDRQDSPEKRELSKRFISDMLISKINHRLLNKEQTLLFLNRRGYAPLVLCQKCGYRFSCKQCSSFLVEHKHPHRLVCHHCGYTLAPPQVCPVCESEESFVSCGPGVERISEEIKALFPQAKQCVMASDMGASALEIKAMMEKIEQNEVDIIIGTQMLAKGHHFPSLTLVGVIDADLGLSGGDLRAGERTFQMLNQVAGRAGREDKKGEVFLQTFTPENQIMQALKNADSEAFFEAEIASRELLKMPPFGRLAGLVISSVYEDKALKTANVLAKKAPQSAQVRVLGPVPAPLFLLRGKYRFRLLLQTTRQIKIQDVVQKWLEKCSIPNAVRVQVDIDPYSFF